MLNLCATLSRLCQLRAGQGLLYVDWLIMANIVPVWCIWSVHFVYHVFAFLCTLTYRWKPYSQVQHLSFFVIWKEHQVFWFPLHFKVNSPPPQSTSCPCNTFANGLFSDPFLSALKGILNINCWRYSLMKSMNSSKNSLWSLWCQFTIKFNHNLGWVFFEDMID